MDTTQKSSQMMSEARYAPANGLDVSVDVSEPNNRDRLRSSIQELHQMIDLVERDLDYILGPSLTVKGDQKPVEPGRSSMGDYLATQTGHIQEATIRLRSLYERTDWDSVGTNG